MIAAPELLAETREILPALRHTATAHAGDAGVKAVISRRFPLYPQPSRSEAEWEAWWSDYLETLSDLALASLEAAMRAYVADPESEYMPKPGRLRELAFITPCKSLKRYHRAMRAIQLADEPPPAERVATPEMAEAIRKMAATTIAELKRTPDLKPLLPSIAGKTDETGITPEMREALARRAERAAS